MTALTILKLGNGQQYKAQSSTFCAFSAASAQAEIIKSQRHQGEKYFQGQAMMQPDYFRQVQAQYGYVNPGEMQHKSTCWMIDGAEGHSHVYKRSLLGCENFSMLIAAAGSCCPEWLFGNKNSMHPATCLGSPGPFRVFVFHLLVLTNCADRSVCGLHAMSRDRPAANCAHVHADELHPFVAGMASNICHRAVTLRMHMSPSCDPEDRQLQNLVTTCCSKQAL